MEPIYLRFLTRYLLSQPVPRQPAAPSPGGQAAVLVPIILHPQEPTILLTKRSLTLRQHPGQVAFPGGKRDHSDLNLVDTALRETEEELGIARHSVALLGRLPQVYSRYNIDVTPYLGTIHPSQRFIPNPDEVSEVFEIPLADILDRRFYIQTEVINQQRRYTINFLRYPEKMVWGMTASILLQLAQQVEVDF